MGVCPSTLVLPIQYHSTYVPYSRVYCYRRFLIILATDYVIGGRGDVVVTGWMVRGSNPGWEKFYRAVWTSPKANPPPRAGLRIDTT
jgi:hypothetical protein